ncbi:DUF3429 domain-containing protein [Meridianimarinicoccus roseus]|jgi:hypothetical protein|uniref:DUF3429 domain-containing protein n=1 Tax=Meridianimarinicoccus roseus TaxID=2072018 RepID=A0A2V2LEC7_9RHOB|nr:DUF3429 domain-containing protein [Meridianimarinicoccus roseus]PWR03928.1 DUF3429 domain-containing protein [Meridianimarinicoccus roseus]
MTNRPPGGEPRIPTAALALGLAGVLPFVWGALTDMNPALHGWAVRTLGPRFAGQYVLIFYGAVILSFMSGVLWGFAARTEGRTAAIGFTVSVIPALWTFFLVGGGEDRATWALIAGFLGLLGLDYGFARVGLAPPWWMNLRSLLTVLVVGCLTLGLLF